MKERPILFQPHMVRAIMNGKQTVTRRIIKSPERYSRIRDCAFGCRYQPGDLLWVRERWAEVDEEYGCPVIAYATGHAHYIGKTDERGGDHLAGECNTRYAVDKWRPSIFMPRWASRLTLEITKVEVQRLQEISDLEAEAEGVSCDFIGDFGSQKLQYQPDRQSMSDERYYKRSELVPGIRGAFAQAWDQMHGRTAPWVSNPWVWVITFSKL